MIISKLYGSTGSQVVTFLEGVKRCQFDLLFCGPFQEGCALTHVNHSSTELAEVSDPKEPTLQE